MEVYIEFLNKDKGFKVDRKEFESYEIAIEWGVANLDNFHIDMVKFN